MINNDILRRLRYAFDIDDSKMIALFALADLEVSREEISDWLKKEEDPAYKLCNDTQLATFLNGFINDKRGKKDGPQPEPEKRLTNNLVFRKLRIALNLKDDGILDILKLVDYRLSKHELSAFFRREDHRQYRECKDQIIRNFLNGLQLQHRPDATPAKASTEIKKDAVTTPTKVAPSKTVSSTVKKDSKPEFKWQEDRNLVKTNTEKKEIAAATKDEGSKAAFKWNEDSKASKSRADKKEPLTAPTKKGKYKDNDTKPAFKWKED